MDGQHRGLGKEYERVKDELAKALAQRADKTKKTTVEDDKKKAALQKQLLKQQTHFKEE